MNLHKVAITIQSARQMNSCSRRELERGLLVSIESIDSLHSAVERVTSLLEFRRSTSNIATIINFAVSLLDHTAECYLNIGVWKGYTLFSGAIGNSRHLCIGVDHFDPAYLARMTPRHDAEVVKAELRHVKRQINLPNLQLFEMSFEKFLRRFPDATGKQIGCLIYDADHRTEATIKALDLAKPYLSKNCIIFIDDYNIPGVAGTVETWMKDNPEFNTLLKILTCRDQDPRWWNGLAVLVRQNANPSST